MFSPGTLFHEALVATTSLSFPSPSSPSWSYERSRGKSVLLFFHNGAADEDRPGAGEGQGREGRGVPGEVIEEGGGVGLGKGRGGMLERGEVRVQGTLRSVEAGYTLRCPVISVT